MDGILCVHKPPDFTSFDVVAKMRGIAKMRKIGHAGTLDPMATGVLPLFLGQATKACHLLPRSDKCYLATVQFGRTTDTLDRTGRVLTQSEERIDRTQLASVLPQFMGEIQQIPPMYSAVKLQGKKLYQLARSGKTVEREARSVTIHALTIVGFDAAAQTARLRVHCSGGTYLRTLADDLGRMLGVGGMLTELVREMAAGFCLAECHTLKTLQTAADEGRLQEYLQPIDTAFSCYPMITLSQAQSVLFLNGVKLDLNRLQLPAALQSGAICRVYQEQDEGTGFLGLAHPYREAGVAELRITKIFQLNGSIGEQGTSR